MIRYRMFNDYSGPNVIVLAEGDDGSIRGVELARMEVDCVAVTRRKITKDGDCLFTSADYECWLGYDQAWTTAQKKPEVDWLARKLFDTDPELLAEIDTVGDWRVGDTFDDTKRTIAMNLAWERNVHGWAERARRRAWSILK